MSKPSGGRWRFEMQLIATEPDLDGTLVIEAALDQTSRLPIYLYSSTDQPQPFTASFTSDTPLSFNVLPSRGVLPPAASEEELGVSGRPRTSTPALEVTYTCRDFGKVRTQK